MNKKSKNKIIALSITIVILTSLLIYLIDITFIADRSLKEMGYSYKQILLLKEYEVEDDVTEYNQSLVYALDSKEFNKDNIRYYVLLKSNMDLTLVCNQLASYYSFDDLQQLLSFLSQEEVELLADKDKISNIAIFQRMKEAGYDLDTSITLTNKLPNESVESFFTISSKLDNPLLYLSYLEHGYNDTEIQIIASLGTTDFDNLSNIQYFSSLTTLIQTSGFKIKNLARYLMYMANNNVAANVAVKKVNANADISKTIVYNDTYQADATATINGIQTLVNKSHKLVSTYVPDDLTSLSAKYNYGSCQLVQEAAQAFEEMALACNADYNNVNLMVYYGYQSYEQLDELYFTTLETLENDAELTNKKAIKAGYSEHQTGLACDIGTDKYAPDKISVSKSNTWLKANAYRFGFVQRYPSGKESFTLTPSNIYHYRYVGKEAALIMHNYDWCYEEYYYLFVSTK